jgi:hypothetical protein
VIAPRLRKLAALADPETRREIRALLAVARAARTAPHHDDCGTEFGEECDCTARPMMRALARLQPKRARGRG